MWLLRMKQWYSCQARKQKPVANNLISGTIVDIIQIGSMLSLRKVDWAMSPIHKSELPVNPERDLLKSPKGENSNDVSGIHESELPSIPEREVLIPSER